MIQFRNLTYSIGERKLLSDINWTISDGERMALIGANGAGKTTLLRLLAGEIEIQEGVLLKPKKLRIGYLPQEEIAVGKGTILTNVLEGHRQIAELELKIFDLHRMLQEESADHTALLNQLGDLENQYELVGGYQLESVAKKILAGLGFQPTDYHKPLAEFSGGWQMRVYLARLLIQEPELLLLDEPTNHLDLPSLEWLESYLRNFKGSIVLVSHDRFFIDRLAQEIAELDEGKLTLYHGNYHFYEKEKQLYQEKLFQEWERQQKEIARQQRFIDRFRYKATKAAQVQSRIKQLNKIERIELPPPAKQLHFAIPVEKPSYKNVVTIREMSFRYDQRWIFQEVNLDIYRGERLALVGLNGSGKTTLTRLLSGQLSAQKGVVKLGRNVVLGYYAQHQIDQLNLENTVYNEVLSAAAANSVEKIRDVLGIFNFSGDDILKKIKVLSGGEKARVSLVKILLSPVNFLIMDEPTNHLDLSSRQALENALAEYGGTLLLISHDRYFLDKLVHRVFELKEGRLQSYEGNYSDYLQKREERRVEHISEIRGKTAPSSREKIKEKKRREAEARQAISRERKTLEQEIRTIENRLNKLEQQKTDLENQMADPASYGNSEKAARMQIAYTATTQELEQLYLSWETVQMQLEELMSRLQKND